MTGGFKVKKEPGAKECGQPLEARNGKELNTSLESPENPVDTLVLATQGHLRCLNFRTVR